MYQAALLAAHAFAARIEMELELQLQ